MTIEQLAHEWQIAKLEEVKAQERRRAIEDQLSEELQIQAQSEGTENFDAGAYKIKVTSKLTRKVDGDKLQELAAESGLSDHLTALFRWKPEINMTAWKQADSSITAALAAAITTTPARPGFSITKE